MEALRVKISTENNISRCLYFCLEYTSMNPQDTPIVGVVWINEQEIFMHTKTFGSFISKRPNTINKYMLFHGFSCNKLNNEQQALIMNNLRIRYYFQGVSTLRTNLNIKRSNAAIMEHGIPYQRPINDLIEADQESKPVFNQTIYYPPYKNNENMPFFNDEEDYTFLLEDEDDFIYSFKNGFY